MVKVSKAFDRYRNIPTANSLLSSAKERFSYKSIKAKEV